MRCFHCKEQHASVDQVYTCATKHGFRSATTVQLPDPERKLRPVKPSEQRREDERLDMRAQIHKLGADIEPGRYAIYNRGDGANDIGFYKVEHGKGKWEGKTFVMQLLSDNETRLSIPRQHAAIVAIAANPREALRLYGQKIGRCGHCGRTLTNEESRNYGIGPICRQAIGA